MHLKSHRIILPFLVLLLSACSAGTAPICPPCEQAAAPACPGAPALGAAAPAGTTPAAPAPGETVAPAAVPAATTSATAAVTPPRAQPQAAAACPAGMVLVEGDYCTAVKHRCEVQWFAEANKKKVCEKFTERATCTGKRVPKRFCIDRYAWPNQKGVRPEVMNNFYQAQVKCAAVGKRMCTESEWTFACEGPDMKPFPYGWVRDPRKCNGDQEWDNPDMDKVRRRDPKELARLWRGVPSGSQPDCVSDFGVHDLPANNDEVVAGETSKAKFSSVHTGGPWYSGVRNQCRPKVYTHDEGFYYYFLGFRCCSEPDGKPSEPRTPRQIREGTKWDAIERWAQFSLGDMQEKLRLKAEGKCDCPADKILCKTMCGTLLGPGAVDGTDATRVLHKSRQQIGP